VTNDDAQAWFRYRKIQFSVRPSTSVEQPGWRYKLIRESATLAIVAPDKSALSLVRLIACEAWEKYPTESFSPLAKKL
jgi:hypothetical protein